jgi:uncharacterized protein (DUF488 family)
MKMAKKKATAARGLPLFTIGYEKAKPDAVLDALKRAKVKLLVDTRAVATSRRPGFSKRQLAASLDEAGIDYLHLQKLGTPAEGRQASRAGDYDTLWRIYDKHMETASAREALDELVGLVRTKRRICLLCYERDPAQCHRTHVAARVRKRVKIDVRDLFAELF